MPSVKVLVCDDQHPEEIEEAIKKGMSEGVSVTAKPYADLKSLIAGFFSRGAADGVRGYLRSTFDVRNQEQLASEFDNYDIILLDNNLAELDVEGVPLTAESIAGYIRAFSCARYVISLNKNPEVNFDLKYLVGDFETKADLALNTEHLEIKNLWDGSAGEGAFCPWYWPALSKISRRREQQVKFVQDNLDRPILAALGFPTAARELLSMRAVGFLSPTAISAGVPAMGGAEPVARVTFWNHFQTSNRSLSADNRAAIALPDEADPKERAEKFRLMARAPKDELARKIVARTVAAELDFWIRRDVLGPQEILVDSPHLQMKLRIGLDPAVEVWNTTAIDDDPPYGLAPKLYGPVFSQHKFANEFWTPHPAFWWPSIERDKNLSKLKSDFQPVDEIIVFCEDTRQFVLRKAEGKSGYSFVPDGGKPWNPFYVRQWGVGYTPQSQFAA